MINKGLRIGIACSMIAVLFIINVVQVLYWKSTNTVDTERFDMNKGYIFYLPTTVELDNGKKWEMKYDQNGCMSNFNYDDANDVEDMYETCSYSFAYDDNQNLCQVVNDRFNRDDSEWKNNQVIKYKGQNVDSIEETFMDSDGSQLSHTFYQYDDQGRIVSADMEGDAMLDHAQVTYEDAIPCVRAFHAEDANYGQIDMNYTYEDVNTEQGMQRVIHNSTVCDGTAFADEDVTLVYDKAGRYLGKIGEVKNHSIEESTYKYGFSFSYDEFGRLKQYSDVNQKIINEFSYDENGLMLAINGESVVRDEHNNVTEWSKDGVRYKVSYIPITIQGSQINNYLAKYYQYRSYAFSMEYILGTMDYDDMQIELIGAVEEGYADDLIKHYCENTANMPEFYIHHINTDVLENAIYYHQLDVNKVFASQESRYQNITVVDISDAEGIVIADANSSKTDSTTTENKDIVREQDNGTTELVKEPEVEEKQDVTVYLPVKSMKVDYSSENNQPNIVNNMEYDEHGYLKKFSWEGLDYVELHFSYDQEHQLNECTCPNAKDLSIKFGYEDGEIAGVVTEMENELESCRIKDGKIVDEQCVDYANDITDTSKYNETKTESGYEISGTATENDETYSTDKLTYKRDKEDVYKIKASRKYSDATVKYVLSSKHMQDEYSNETLIDYERTSDGKKDLAAYYGIEFDHNNLQYIYGGYEESEQMSFFYNYDNNLLSSAYIGDGQLYFERDSHGNITKLNDHVIEYKKFTVPADEWNYYRDHYYYLYRSFGYCGINEMLNHEVALDEGYAKNLINEYTPYSFIEQLKYSSCTNGMQYYIQSMVEKIGFFNSLDTKSIYDNHQRLLSEAGYQ